MQYSNESRADASCCRSLVVLAGLAGGMIEIAWVTLYSSLTTASAADMARQVAATALPATAGSELAPAFGVGIHLVLSIALAAAFAAFLFGPIARRFGAVGILVSGLTTLSAVWAVNFFILLPLLNPAFPALMPYAVTLTSKLLFGAAMSAVLINRASAYRMTATSSM
jgi:hypothetical protein